MILWVIIIVTIFFSAIFSGSEIAFVSSNKLKLELDRKRGNIPARIVGLMGSSPSRLIASLLLGNNVVLVIYGLAMSDLLDPQSGPFQAAWAQAASIDTLPASLVVTIQTILSTITILLLGEFLPKVLYRINPNNALYVSSWILLPMYYLLFIPTRIFIWTSDWILRVVFRVKGEGDGYQFTSTDLHEYIREYQHSEVTAEEDITQEVQMFQNVMEFKNIKLRECMVPRTEIVAVEQDDLVTDLKQKFIETGLSRVLVFKESIDHIIGYVHSFDMFREPQNINEVLKPVIIVPEAMLASKLLSMFSQEHKSVAVVVDEFGGTSGMVTPEDVFEEIFGEIRDEFDTEDLTEKTIGNNEFIFAARLEIDYLNAKYNLGLPTSEDYETLAGLILHHHEHIPEVNEEIEIPNFSFKIQQATATRIEQVRLKILE